MTDRIEPDDNGLVAGIDYIDDTSNEAISDFELWLNEDG